MKVNSKEIEKQIVELKKTNMPLVRIIAYGVGVRKNATTYKKVFEVREQHMVENETHYGFYTRNNNLSKASLAALVKLLSNPEVTEFTLEATEPSNFH
jgi:predicted membrane-bound dolichyl-phosphate-mannose-protein mannosyltransferase